MHAIFTNQIPDILHFNDKGIYRSINPFHATGLFYETSKNLWYEMMECFKVLLMSSHSMTEAATGGVL